MVDWQYFRQRFASFAALAPHEADLLAGTRSRPIFSHANGDRIRANNAFLVAGWASREAILPDGRRQILQLAMPGEPLAATNSPPEVQLVSLHRAVTVDGSHIMAAAAQADKYPGIAAALAAMEIARLHYLYQQVVRLGRMTAQERTASFLLEVWHRQSVQHRDRDRKLSLPMTQSQIADLLGLSVVHVNRTLQDLRRNGIIQFERGVLQLVQLDKLQGLVSTPAGDKPRRDDLMLASRNLP